METAKNRLIEYLKDIKMGQNAFEAICGISNGYISKVKSSIGSDIISKISDAYPDLNIVWLITGKGEKFNDAETQATKSVKPCPLCKEKERALRHAEHALSRSEDKIAYMERDLENTQAKLEASKKENVRLEGIIAYAKSGAA